MNMPNSRHSIQEKKRQNIHKCHTFCPILGRIMSPKDVHVQDTGMHKEN